MGDKGVKLERVSAKPDPPSESMSLIISQAPHHFKAEMEPQMPLHYPATTRTSECRSKKNFNMLWMNASIAMSFTV